MKRLLFLFTLLLSFAVSAAEKPKMFVGVDAQPPSQMPWVAKLKANMVHRYENGPQKNILLREWLTALRANGLYGIVQGSAIDAQNAWALVEEFSDVIIAIAHDDEPDLNRPVGATSATQYTMVTAPHVSMIGWQTAEFLQSRYKFWKSILASKPSTANIPICVNFAGAKIGDINYTVPLTKHAGYIAASDYQSFDQYPVQEKGDAGHLYWLANIIDKINASGGHCWGAYLECSFGEGGWVRGPTPNEQSIEFWVLAAHGVREISYFSQHVLPPFSYNAMKPENEAQARLDNALFLKHGNLLLNGTYVRTPVPKPKNTFAGAPVGKAIWPDTEVTVVTLGTETLTISLDFIKRTPPVITYVNTAPPTTQPDVPATQPTTQPVDRFTEIEKRLAEIEAWKKLVQGK